VVYITVEQSSRFVFTRLQNDIILPNAGVTWRITLGGGGAKIDHEYFVCFWRDSPQWARASSFTRFINHTIRRTTVGTTPLDEWTARSRDLYLTTHNNHNRQTSILPIGFEHTISAGEQPQTYALDLAATGAGYHER